MALPARPQPTRDAIYARWRARGESEGPRAHLGASLIGRECARAVWYAFRWCSPPALEGRLYRLFDTGVREERRVVEDLRAVGVEVFQGPAPGQQYAFAEHGGHFAGSIDGVVTGLAEAPKTPHLLEVKTSNARAFAKLEKEGVRAAKPEHFAQIQAYLHFSGQRSQLERALYIVVNKDTDAIYTERVERDAAVGEALSKRALEIIRSETPLERVSENAAKPPCSWCDHRAVCHEGALPAVSCRSCIQAEPLTDGEGARWRCGRDGALLGRDRQRMGCQAYLPVPELVPWAADVTAAGEGWYEVEVRGEGRRVCIAEPEAFPGRDVPVVHGRDVRAAPPTEERAGPVGPGGPWLTFATRKADVSRDAWTARSATTTRPTVGAGGAGEPLEMDPSDIDF